jgi:2-oxoglutarate ferredoxin oxidoreductase subunit alpha
VVVDVQRGGPATGLPTKTEQSDLLTAIYPAHGDSRMPVIAPGTVEECFYGSVMAFNWAERYQGPVMLLSEHSLAERAQNIRKPDLANVAVENRVRYTGSNDYLRYEAKGLSPFSSPGGPGSYIANGSEHDVFGDTTHLAKYHIHMTERRFSKLALLEDGEYEVENNDAKIVIMPWGGSKGSVREALDLLIEEGVDLGWYYTMFVSPLPAKMLAELRSKDLVIVPELNFQGQMALNLRSQGIKAEAITQYTGLPFGPRNLADRIKELLAGIGQPTGAVKA